MLPELLEEKNIQQILKSAPAPGAGVTEILAKARQLRGLTQSEAAQLCNIQEPELLSALFESARWVKDHIYGQRLVLFAPLYISNLCSNDCLYCAFRARNKHLKRRALTQTEIAREVTILVEQGHKRLLLVAGEAPRGGLQYILDSVQTVYATKSGRGEIRRVNVNIAPLTADEFQQLRDAQIGTYQLFQETYHQPTYERVHRSGPKANYAWRLAGMDRAMSAGIKDVGIGALFGLYDWRYEILALLGHAAYLEQRYGTGPHTISVPRLEPADGSEMASAPPHPVDDLDFQKIVAILRLAVPYTGIIMSTRETAPLRRATFALGVSQISAGSRTNPGGYATAQRPEDESQFALGDHRPLDEVIGDIATLGYIPSFCTACYRLGRTGKDFMDLAKPGAIKAHCDPNALSTFMEYLLDYASPATRRVGEECVRATLASMAPQARQRALKMIAKVRGGQRDVYC